RSSTNPRRRQDEPPASANPRSSLVSSMTSRLNDDTLRITLRGPSESLCDSKIDENALASSAHNKQGHTPIFALRHNKQGHTPIFALGKPWKKLGQKKLQKTGTDTIIGKKLGQAQLLPLDVRASGANPAINRLPRNRRIRFFRSRAATRPLRGFTLELKKRIRPAG
ncbi:hypothetical protein, partial [uncultured Maricaulis sp.]|uniref:hypothetical protein n=1 Tax=uncultured Maricaulis sp. TaxID=174710 RepID=UPI0025CCAE57